MEIEVVKKQLLTNIIDNLKIIENFNDDLTIIFLKNKA